MKTVGFPGILKIINYIKTNLHRWVWLWVKRVHLIHLIHLIRIILVLKVLVIIINLISHWICLHFTKLILFIRKLIWQ